jgi:hypothetical protein
MKIDRSKLIWLSLGAALIFLSLAFWNFKTDSSHVVVGEVTRSSGEVLWLQNEKHRATLVRKTQLLHSQEGLETNDAGEALLNLQNDASIKVLASTEVWIEQKAVKDSLQMRMNVVRGEVQVVRSGDEEHYPLFIGRNGHWALSSQYVETIEGSHAINVAGKEGTSGSPSSQATNSFTSNETTRNTPTSDEIKLALRGHQADFFKCYTRLLQSFPEVTGHAQLSFTIPGSGHIDGVSVDLQMLPLNKHLPSDFDDFSRCLKAVTLRLEFRPFSGPSVAAVYPIQFE